MHAEFSAIDSRRSVGAAAPWWWGGRSDVDQGTHPFGVPQAFCAVSCVAARWVTAAAGAARSL